MFWRKKKGRNKQKDRNEEPKGVNPFSKFLESLPEAHGFKSERFAASWSSHPDPSELGPDELDPVYAWFEDLLTSYISEFDLTLPDNSTLRAISGALVYLSHILAKFFVDDSRISEFPISLLKMYTKTLLHIFKNLDLQALELFINQSSVLKSILRVIESLSFPLNECIHLIMEDKELKNFRSLWTRVLLTDEVLSFAQKLVGKALSRGLDNFESSPEDVYAILLEMTLGIVFRLKEILTISYPNRQHYNVFSNVLNHFSVFRSHMKSFDYGEVAEILFLMLEPSTPKKTDNEINSLYEDLDQGYELNKVERDLLHYQTGIGIISLIQEFISLYPPAEAQVITATNMIKLSKFILWTFFSFPSVKTRAHIDSHKAHIHLILALERMLKNVNHSADTEFERIKTQLITDSITLILKRRIKFLQIASGNVKNQIKYVGKSFLKLPHTFQLKCIRQESEVEIRQTSIESDTGSEELRRLFEMLYIVSEISWKNCPEGTSPGPNSFPWLASLALLDIFRSTGKIFQTIVGETPLLLLHRVDPALQRYVLKFILLNSARDKFWIYTISNGFLTQESTLNTFLSKFFIYQLNENDFLGSQSAIRSFRALSQDTLSLILSIATARDRDNAQEIRAIFQIIKEESTNLDLVALCLRYIYKILKNNFTCSIKLVRSYIEYIFDILSHLDIIYDLKKERNFLHHIYSHSLFNSLRFTILKMLNLLIPVHEFNIMVLQNQEYLEILFRLGGSRKTFNIFLLFFEKAAGEHFSKKKELFFQNYRDSIVKINTENLRKFFRNYLESRVSRLADDRVSVLLSEIRSKISQILEFSATLRSPIKSHVVQRLDQLKGQVSRLQLNSFDKSSIEYLSVIVSHLDEVIDRYNIPAKTPTPYSEYFFLGTLRVMARALRLHIDDVISTHIPEALVESLRFSLMSRQFSVFAVIINFYGALTDSEILNGRRLSSVLDKRVIPYIVFACNVFGFENVFKVAKTSFFHRDPWKFRGEFGAIVLITLMRVFPEKKKSRQVLALLQELVATESNISLMSRHGVSAVLFKFLQKSLPGSDFFELVRGVTERIVSFTISPAELLQLLDAVDIHTERKPEVSLSLLKLLRNAYRVQASNKNRPTHFMEFTDKSLARVDPPAIISKETFTIEVAFKIEKLVPGSCIFSMKDYVELYMDKEYLNYKYGPMSMLPIVPISDCVGVWTKLSIQHKKSRWKKATNISITVNGTLVISRMQFSTLPQTSPQHIYLGSSHGTRSRFVGFISRFHIDSATPSDSILFDAYSVTKNHSEELVTLNPVSSGNHVLSTSLVQVHRMYKVGASMLQIGSAPVLLRVAERILLHAPRSYLRELYDVFSEITFRQILLYRTSRDEMAHWRGFSVISYLMGNAKADVPYSSRLSRLLERLTETEAGPRFIKGVVQRFLLNPRFFFTHDVVGIITRFIQRYNVEFSFRLVTLERLLTWPRYLGVESSQGYERLTRIILILLQQYNAFFVKKLSRSKVRRVYKVKPGFIEDNPLISFSSGQILFLMRYGIPKNEVQLLEAIHSELLADNILLSHLIRANVDYSRAILSLLHKIRDDSKYNRALYLIINIFKSVNESTYLREPVISGGSDGISPASLETSFDGLEGIDLIPLPWTEYAEPIIVNSSKQIALDCKALDILYEGCFENFLTGNDAVLKRPYMLRTLFILCTRNNSHMERYLSKLHHLLTSNEKMVGNLCLDRWSFFIEPVFWDGVVTTEVSLSVLQILVSGSMSRRIFDALLDNVRYAKEMPTFRSALKRSLLRVLKTKNARIDWASFVSVGTMFRELVCAGDSGEQPLSGYISESVDDLDYACLSEYVFLFSLVDVREKHSATPGIFSSYFFAFSRCAYVTQSITDLADLVIHTHNFLGHLSGSASKNLVSSMVQTVLTVVFFLCGLNPDVDAPPPKGIPLSTSIDILPQGDILFNIFSQDNSKEHKLLLLAQHAFRKHEKLLRKMIQSYSSTDEGRGLPLVGPTSNLLAALRSESWQGIIKRVFSKVSIRVPPPSQATFRAPAMAPDAVDGGTPQDVMYKHFRRSLFSKMHWQRTTRYVLSQLERDVAFKRGERMNALLEKNVPEPIWDLNPGLSPGLPLPQMPVKGVERCSILRFPDTITSGAFIDTQKSSRIKIVSNDVSIRMRISDIKMALPRIYRFQDVGLELVMKKPDEYRYLIFESREARNRILEFFLEHGKNPPDIHVLRKSWKKDEISNYEYLVYLNLLAGRSFCDENRYPVFPWVIADYRSESINLNDPSVYRDLSKQVGALNPVRLEKLRERAMIMRDEYFLYGHFYSTREIVRGYLSRIYAPDGSAMKFESVAGMFDNVLQSMSNFSELIPEFYYLSGMFEAGNGLGGVELPPWAHGDPQEFVRTNRTAIESRYVTENLHLWIDMVFGYRQRGKFAAEVHNVFEKSFYSVTDRMPGTGYALVPEQLFFEPHSKKEYGKHYRDRIVPKFVLQKTFLTSSLWSWTLRNYYEVEIIKGRAIFALDMTMGVKKVGKEYLIATLDEDLTLGIHKYVRLGSSFAFEREPLPKSDGSSSGATMRRLRFGKITTRMNSSLISIFEEYCAIGGYWDDTVVIVNVHQKKMLARLQLPSRAVSVMISAHLLAVGTVHGMVRIYTKRRSFKSPDLRITIAGRGAPVAAMDVCSFLGLVAVSYESSRTVSLYHLADAMLQMRFQIPRGRVIKVKLLTSSLVVLATSKGELLFYDLFGKLIAKDRFRVGVWHFSENHDVMICANSQGSLGVWDLLTLENIRKISLGRSVITSLSMIEAECKILVGLSSGQMQIIDFDRITVTAEKTLKMSNFEN